MDDHRAVPSRSAMLVKTARKATRRLSRLLGTLDAMGYEVTLCRKPDPEPEAAPAP